MILDSSDCSMKKSIKGIEATLVDKILIETSLLDVAQEAFTHYCYELLKLVIIFLRRKRYTSSSQRILSADAELSTYRGRF